MNERTRQALAAINRRFYRDHAEAFDATRTAPWPGWQRLLPALRAAARRGPLRVLDVGCGNGRFARALAEALGGSDAAAWSYCGIDASAPLLAAARRAGPPGAHWVRADPLAHAGALPPGPFELVALFGVIHGVPGRAQRRALLAECAARVGTGGRLVFTTWRFGADARLDARRLTWSDYNARAAVPIDTAQLEPGDRLLPWGEGRDVVRYVHAFDEDELAECSASLPLRPELRYRADGRSGESNEYFVFRAA